MAKTRIKREYTQEIANEICNAIATSTKGLKALCELNPHWPRQTTINEWIFKHDDFNDQYARAKLKQTEANIDLLQEYIEIDHYYKKSDDRVLNESLLRTKIDTIKWMASKLHPRKFGDVKEETNNNRVHEETMAHKAALDEKNKKDY
jgi:hypothetical protein